MAREGKAPEGASGAAASRNPDPVLLNWIETFEENRGLDLPAKIIIDDPQPQSRGTMASFEGLTPYPLPDFFDRVAEKEVPLDSVLKELRNGYDILKNRPIELYKANTEEEEGQEVDAAWAKEEPKAVAEVIRQLAAQRDTATGVMVSLHKIAEQRIATLQVAMERA